MCIYVHIYALFWSKFIVCNMLGLRLKLHMLLLLQLNLRSVGSISTDTPSEPEMPERCKYLQSSNEVMFQKCKGKFPLVAYTKFRDTFMKQTDRMALFMPESLDHILVSLKDSQLHYCYSIQVLEVNEYLCFDEFGGKRTIKLRSARMYCFPFHIQLTDDLMHECILERDGVTESVLEANTLRTKRGIIHYTFDNDSAVRYLMSKRNVMIQMLVVLAMLSYF
ncbi:uncharacterized protein LOC6585018 [Drosophila mojavensis]|uniref:Uncharacterized protein n=1 Tax=Drosophila mojavensis TaxID=7230 RepID=B4L554_DROMO|nr:uncharacterized protein LOC6585018 [Drosophila mojavensis]EDW06313.2 uncharacterized protein Dmoj_GI21663 [Drosophila mojavensis]